MSKSLQDQLVALGLGRVEQTRQESGKKVQNTRRSPPSGQQANPRPAGKPQADVKVRSRTPTSAELSLEAAYRLREQQVKEQADRTREQKRLMDLERRRMNEALREIVMPHRLNDELADLTRNFLYRGRIRKISVTAPQLRALNAGELGLVYLAGGYHILAPEWVETVRQLSQEHVPDLSGSSGTGPGDDEEFPVPDDLIW